MTWMEAARASFVKAVVDEARDEGFSEHALERIERAAARAWDRRQAEGRRP